MAGQVPCGPWVSEPTWPFLSSPLANWGRRRWEVLGMVLLVLGGSFPGRGGLAGSFLDQDEKMVGHLQSLLSTLRKKKKGLTSLFWRFEPPTV